MVSPAAAGRTGWGSLTGSEIPMHIHFPQFLSAPAVVLLFLGLPSCAGTPSGPPPLRTVLGVWHVESDLPGRTIPANLILQEGEDGVLSGLWESMDQEMDLRSISFVEGVLRFERSMGRGGPPLAFEGSVVDGELHGLQRTGDMEISCVGRRFKLDRETPEERAPSLISSGDLTTYLGDLEADYDRNASRAVPRDGFDVLDSPELVPAAEATTLEDDEYVLGVEVAGEARAYPIGALGHSELLNDVCGGVPIAASW